MTVVAAYTPRARGDAVLEAALLEAGRRRCDVVVVNVARGDGLPDRAAVGPHEVERLREHGRGRGVGLTVRLVDHADTAAAVLDLAAAEAAELLVVGIRRRSQVGKILLGSTAQRLLLDSTCPVLAVKA